MKVSLYCVGFGPGEPELLTLKALKIIRTCPVLAVPQSRTGVVTAQGILMKALEGCGITIDDKTVIAMDFPMTRDNQVLKGAHEKAAHRLRDELDEGRDVCLITLGCPTVYATSIYVHRLIRQYQRRGKLTEEESQQSLSYHTIASDQASSRERIAIEAERETDDL